MERQTSKKFFIPLTLKLVIAVGLSLLAVFVLYEIMEGVKQVVVQKYYLSDQAEERNVNEAFDDFKNYVRSGHLKSTDTDRLQSWIIDHDYTNLMVFDNYSISFDGGWTVNPTTGDGSGASEDQSSVNPDETQPRITADTFKQDLKNRILTFDDGDYYVFIDVYKEQHLYRIFDVMELVMGVGVVIGVLLFYNARLMNRIAKVSQYAENVTAGDLGATIKASANDEVGRLATSVDTMRASLIKRLINEKEAWDKNSELITAMSHDIRTPLTSLIGYLDIIESGKYQSDEEAMKYVSASRDKAFQLKDLSDKLFQYFLVFGSHGSEKNLEVYDASILIQQLLSEHSAELINHGFKVDFSYEIPEGVEIEADVSGLRRLFDNIFSNIVKYADKKSPVKVTGEVRDKNIIVFTGNRIREDSRSVESNKIGLKTCEKICKDMGGDFKYTDEEQEFNVDITLPTYSSEEAIVHEEGIAGINVHDIDLETLAETIVEERPVEEEASQEEGISEGEEEESLQEEPKKEGDTIEQD